MLTEQQKRDCLAYEPFEGDFGMPSDMALKDKVVVGRVSRPCNECLQPTEPGTNHRVMTWIFDGELHYYRICEKCCVAMAAWVNGDEDPMDDRSRIGDEARTKAWEAQKEAT